MNDQTAENFGILGDMRKTVTGNRGRPIDPKASFALFPSGENRLVTFINKLKTLELST
jgi:hypothetical protein